MPRAPDVCRHAGSSAAEASLRPLRGVDRLTDGPRSASVFVLRRSVPAAVQWPTEDDGLPTVIHRSDRATPRLPWKRSRQRVQLHLKGQRRRGRTILPTYGLWSMRRSSPSPSVRGEGQDDNTPNSRYISDFGDRTHTTGKNTSR